MRGTRRAEGETIDAIRPENNFGIYGALEDIFLHLGIASVAAAAAAGGIGGDFTSNEICRRIDANLAAFQIEFTMHVVPVAPNVKLNFDWAGTRAKTICEEFDDPVCTE